MSDHPVHIGLLYLDLFIPDAQSLKDKRQVVKSLKDKVRHQFNVSVSEIDGQDKWQVATLSVVMIGNDNRYIDSSLQNIVSFIETHREVELTGQSLEFV